MTSTLHVFNPEYELALVGQYDHFTPPQPVRKMRSGLGFLSSLLCSSSDIVLVDDVREASRQLSVLNFRLWRLGMTAFAGSRFLSDAMLPGAAVDAVVPWGWTASFRNRLARAGVGAALMPSDSRLAAVRELSSRATSAWLLPLLRFEGTVGESFIVTSRSRVAALFSAYGRLVVKAPWSCSGRGLRLVESMSTVHLAGWIDNVIARQGCIAVEPYYNKVCDFAMEFYSDGRGKAVCLGLSLFACVNGSYSGNVLASESVKRSCLQAFLPAGLLDDVCRRICRLMGLRTASRYRGMFGVDMMIVESGGRYLLHPCVEINLRPTMGHVALSVALKGNGLLRRMKVESKRKYQINII